MAAGEFRAAAANRVTLCHSLALTTALSQLLISEGYTEGIFNPLIS